MHTFLSGRKIIDTPPAHLQAHKGKDQKNAERLAGALSENPQMCWWGVNYLPSAQESVHVYNR